MRLTIRRRGIATTAALVLAAGGALAAGPAFVRSDPWAATADGSHGPGARSTALQRHFEQAAREFGVPVPVLLAVAYQESRWDGHPGRFNTSGGYGLMNLTDVTPAMADGHRAAADPALHTLAEAARLTGEPAGRLRADDLANLRGGAALLAARERRLAAGAPPADPARWYDAVAAYSRSADRATAERFADDVYRLLVTGAARTTAAGQLVRLAAAPALRPRPAPATRAAGGAGFGDAECPAGLRCSVVPAAHAGFQDAGRPADGLRIRYIVIHDTEGRYDAAVAAFRDPVDDTAANYVMRASDGAVTQMVRDEDLAFHAGNYWFNMHSVGIEHEGFAAEGATWYTEAQYRATADLVRYLAARYGVPLDRRHVIGHDNVPGPSTGSVSGMHWDPGPYWDWAHFMDLLGAGIPRGGTGAPATGSAVTITPDFARNAQPVDVCGAPAAGGERADCARQRQPSNFLYVRTAPAPDAPLFADRAIHPAGGRGRAGISDWGDTVSAGQQFVVAGRKGDWTAIWFSGAKVWFFDPDGVNTAPAGRVTVVTAAGPATGAPVYGQAYPRPAEYPAGRKPSAGGPLAEYSVPRGQSYVATADPDPADDFFAAGPPDSVVTGSARYYTVQYNHRLALLAASDVVRRAT